MDIYVHMDGDTVTEGTQRLAEEIPGDFSANCAAVVTQASKLVS